MNRHYIGMLMQIFSVNADMKIHKGSLFSLVKGTIVADSKKQKVNTRILTESELIRVDYRISKILWTHRFLKCH